jgi:DNA-directed RNA polymerase specialized sigma24 family protein
LALERLLRRHERAIYGLAVRMLWKPRDAEDATQEILLKIATRLSSSAASARSGPGRTGSPRTI